MCLYFSLILKLFVCSPLDFVTFWPFSAAEEVLRALLLLKRLFCSFRFLVLEYERETSFDPLAPGVF